MSRKDFILTLLSPILAIFGYKWVPPVVKSRFSNLDQQLFSLVRRSMPNLMAYDICGVQPMTAPAGLIFAMKSKYTDTKCQENILS